MPLFRPVDQKATFVNLMNHLQATLQNPCLCVGIGGLAEVVSHGKVHKETSRRLYLERQIPASRQADSGDARFFYYSTDQTHGLVIERSGGCRD